MRRGRVETGRRVGGGSWAYATLAAIAAGVVGCGGGGSSQFGGGQGGSGAIGTRGGGGIGAGALGSGGVVVGSDGGTGQITATIRDFKFYDPKDSRTVPDFENPPYAAPPSAGGNGWDDHDIVAPTLGADGKPVYKNASGQTLTTHGKAAFDNWYHDAPGTNYAVVVPLALTANGSGGFTYDSNVSGVPYNVPGQTGNGFFPIDDGTPYATPFGNQIPVAAQPPYMGASHNYSFTVEIDTVFTYAGGETFSFRGDDDVFVFIDGRLVIDLGGIHAPETASVNVDSLGLTVGRSYALNFFSAERHVTGSNIEFTTTLHLQPGGPPPK